VSEYEREKRVSIHHAEEEEKAREQKVDQDDPIEDFLQGRRIACLATEEPDGSAYLTAVWFLYEDGVVYVGTSGSSRKARNAVARPRAAVMIDSRGPGPQRGVAASGRATVLGGAEARAVNDRILQRYLTPAGIIAPDVGQRIGASDDVAIRIEVGRWRTWSTSEDFDGRLEAPGLALPLEH
jgi:PPOX class probable F420-dependent enzyme